MVQDQKTLGENITMTHLVHFDKKYPITELDIVFCVEVKDLKTKSAASVKTFRLHNYGSML